ncbi:hypothetical protein SEA_LUCKYSOCKE_136 [Streptomyces phage LuckySocke]|jgi:hypothetical protein|nr:hypothetical protein SEA_ALONE_141 [Streptomyces phage Alone3]WPH58932.1 hypothetical protein SEA_LUCKYSOCKE_136 [Streptomyces phage LuckySocke]
MAAKRTAVAEDTKAEVVEHDTIHSVHPIDGVLEYTVTSTLKVNYGDYEAHHAFAAVKGRYSPEQDIDAVAADMDERVFSLMNPQLEAALPLSIKESFVRKLG